MAKSRLKIAALFYSLLAVIAVIWSFVEHGHDFSNLFFHPEPAFLNDSVFTWVLIGASLGIGFGLLVARLSKFLVHKWNWAKGLHIEFRGLLGPLADVDVLVFALLSAIGEELLFRGAIQSSFGIVPASIVFGLLHIGPNRKFLPWPAQAIVMGFALGGLFWLTGNLVAPILAHFTINYQNLHFINKYDPSLQLPRAFQKFNHQ